MNRKWAALAATLTSVALLAVGVTTAQDQPAGKGPLHEIMEEVQAKNTAILKGVRTAVAYKKGQKDVVAAADRLIELGKKAREIRDAAEAQKQPYETWTKLMDIFLKDAEAFSQAVHKDATTQLQAKAAYRAVSKRCTECHEVFRIDEEGFE